MTVLAAALSSLILSLAPDAALAQTTAPARPAAPVAAAAPARVAVGVQPQAVADWLKSVGLTNVGPVQQEEGRTFITVVQGGLSWQLFFYGCGPNGLCFSLQFTTSVGNANVTPELVARWNRERRFLKAIYEAPAGSEGAVAVIQYDFLADRDGSDQIANPLLMWLQTLPEFVTQAVGGQAATQAPGQTPAAPAAN